jgi:hypothetical protein
MYLLCGGQICTDRLPENLRPRRKVEMFVTSKKTFKAYSNEEEIVEEGTNGIIV